MRSGAAWGKGVAMDKGDIRLSIAVGPADHVVGPDNAAITLVEYGDYECPYCAEAYPVPKALYGAFLGSLRFVFRNFPLPDVHAHAEFAAEVAEAAALQGKFWEVHDLLFEHQDDLRQQAVLGYADQAGANIAQVRAALGTEAPRRRVQEDRRGGLASGVGSTPTFFVNGELYDGSWSLAPFSDYLEQILTGPVGPHARTRSGRD